MNNDNSSDDGISGIGYERLAESVFAEWQRGKNLHQIAVDLDLPIVDVQRILCERQKITFSEGKLRQ